MIKHRSHRSRQSPATVDRPTLTQFVVLSILLHMLAIALFGNTTGAGGRRGGVFWGQLDVTMQRLLPEDGSGPTLSRGGYISAPAKALARRSPGTKAAPAMRPPIEKHPAARSPQSPDVKPIERPPASAEFAQPPQDAAPPTLPQPAQSPATQLPSREALPHFDPNAPNVVDRPLVKPVAAVVTPPPAIEPEVAPPAQPAPREVPGVPAAAPEPIAPP